MNDHNLHDSHPSALARLLDADAPGQGGWLADELGAILWFQLAAPLTADLGGDDARVRARVLSLETIVDPPIRTFLELLNHPTPPLELLEITKEFAKAARRDPENRLPGEVATVLYYTCLAVALTRCRQSLTGLEEGKFREGLGWVLAQPWVDAKTKALIQPAVTALQAGR